jgi:hypothetical protein
MILVGVAHQNYDCAWDESKNEAKCEQRGQVTPELRNILVRQLEQLGVPAKAPGEINFTVWKPNRADWLLAQAHYSHRTGDDIELCEVVAVVDQKARVTVFRKLPLTKTNLDVPDVTEWSLLDVADTRGDGKLACDRVKACGGDDFFG